MTKPIQEPLMTVWFGNFYSPAYDDQAFVDQSMTAIRQAGFNCILLDTKAWEDFRTRCEGGKASPYVAQQEYMMRAAQHAGLSYAFLSLYLNGDNLYPNIRFSPPIYGESVTRPDGGDGHWYKYWSDKAQQSQEDHVRRLMHTYGKDQAAITVNEQSRLPMCSMWDPIAAPSFDEDGCCRYLCWLEKRYGSIQALNAAYGTNFTSFADMHPQDWWFTVRHGEGSCYTLQDLRDNTPDFLLWADNMRWLADELTQYFAAMQKRLHGVNPQLYLMPNLTQWSHLLSIDTSRKSDIGLCELWDTAMRGINMRAIAPYVDMAHYYTVPVTIDGDPDAYVVSCQHAHIRSMNQGRSFLGGIYYGRFLYNDVYRVVTPEEVVGSMVAQGVNGISAYGWCGMDDGGLLHRMDEGFTASLTRANQWARAVIPQLGAKKRSRVALLFPTAMALLEPLKVQGADNRRNDLLGWYRHLCDLGFAPDMVEAEDVRDGLEGYQVLVIPADDCYHAQRDPAMEMALRAFVQRGGVVIHSQYGEAAEFAFGLVPQPTVSNCYTYNGEGGLLLGAPYVSYPGETLATWREDGATALACTSFGKGRVYSFGFMPGYQIASRTAPHVPLSQRNRELYPLALMQHDPIRDLLLRHAEPDTPITLKDVECTAFAQGWIVVNHRSTPVALTLPGEIYSQQPMTDRTLPARSTAFIRREERP